MKTIGEINTEMSKLAKEREILVRQEKESKYGDHFNTIITKGYVDKEKLMDSISYDTNPDELYYSVGWKSNPKNCRESFTYNGFNITYNFTDDGNYTHYWYITKVDKSQFTFEEITQLIPNYKEWLVERIRDTRENLKNLRKYKKSLEKQTHLLNKNNDMSNNQNYNQEKPTPCGWRRE